MGSTWLTLFNKFFILQNTVERANFFKICWHLLDSPLTAVKFEIENFCRNWTCQFHNWQKKIWSVSFLKNWHLFDSCQTGNVKIRNNIWGLLSKSCFYSVCLFSFYFHFMSFTQWIYWMPLPIHIKHIFARYLPQYNVTMLSFIKHMFYHIQTNHTIM